MKDRTTRDGGAGFSAVSVQKKRGKKCICGRGVREQGNTNSCLQGEAQGREKLEMREPGEVSRVGTCTYVGRKKRDRRRGKL